MAPRSLFSLASLILVGGALVFELFIVLAGAVNGFPIKKWYFLQADTSAIQGAPALSRWTFWNICDGASGNDGCMASGYGNVQPARPLDPPRNFGTSVNVPEQFIGTHYYYLLTRFMFAFALIALFFSAMAFFTGLLALCTRLGAYLSGLMTTLGFIFQALTASLMTAAHVKGRNAFRSQGHAANIGAYAFGFEWAAFVCLFISTILFCMGGSSGKSGKSDTGTTSRGGFMGKRSKSTRSRGSFIAADKEYA